MAITIYPQWQQYWQPLDADPPGFGTEYINDYDIPILQNKSTVLNEFYLGRNGAQSNNKYESISTWAYDGDTPSNVDQNCTLENLNTKLDERVSQLTSGQGIDTLEQDGYQLILDDESQVLDFEDVNINERYNTATNGTSIIFGNLFAIIFGKLFLDGIELQGIEDDGYGENTDFGGKFDPQNPYKVNKRMVRIFIEGYVRRYRILKERFPNADLGCYSLASTFDVLNYDNSDQYECVRRGLSNFLLYINRAGPYGDPNNINYIREDDPGPELGIELLSYMDTASVSIKLGSNIAQKPSPLDNFGDQTQGVNRGVGTLEEFYEDWTIEEATLVMWEQVSTAAGWANTAVSYVNTDPVTGEVLSKGTYKLNDYLNVTIHLPYRFANAGTDTEGRSPIPPQLFDKTLELIQLVNQNREAKFEDIFYWAGSFSGTNTFAFTPSGGVFTQPLIGGDDAGGFQFDPANPYAPTGKLFDLDLFNVSGCDLPPIPLPPEQLQALENIINGEAFRSPVEGAVNSVLSGIGDITSSFADAIDVSLVKPDGTPLATFVDANGVLQIHTAASYMAERLGRATEISNEFQDHAYRLSGVSNYLEGFGEGGSIGDLPGLTGLQAIARNYNNLRNAIDSGNIGEILVDHYSPFFSSILGPGDALYESFNSLVNGDIRNFINTFPITDDRLNLSNATQDQLEDLIALGNAVLDFELSIRNLIDSDNNLYFAALDYLAKTTLGFSVLTMAEDPCFSQKLLGQIAEPDLKGLLNIP